jgi:hypothetical protein
MVKRFIGFVLCLLVCGCGTKEIEYHPNLDLTPYERVGVVSFLLKNVKGSIGKLATQYFIESISKTQGEIEILALGDLDTVLEAVNRQALDAATIKAIGEQFKVPAVLVGTISASNFMEIAEIDDGSGGGHIAELKVVCTAKLFSTETGEKLWQRSSSRDRTFGRGGTASIGIKDGMPYFVEKNAERLYGELIRDLVGGVTSKVIIFMD